jgi:hypothetical protein
MKLIYGHYKLASCGTDTMLKAQVCYAPQEIKKEDPTSQNLSELSLLHLYKRIRCQMGDMVTGVPKESADSVSPSSAV